MLLMCQKCIIKQPEDCNSVILLYIVYILVIFGRVCILYLIILYYKVIKFPHLHIVVWIYKINPMLFSLMWIPIQKIENSQDIKKDRLTT